MNDDCICKSCNHNLFGMCARDSSLSCDMKCDTCFGCDNCDYYSSKSIIKLMTIAVEDWEQLRNEWDRLKQMVNILNDNDNTLRQQIEDMKNCLNCKYGYWDCDDLECRLGLFCKKYCNYWQIKGAE